jgi:hypothetical protein
MKKYRCYHELLWVKRGDYTCIACIHCYSVYKTVKPYDISDDNWIKQSRDGYEATKKKFRSIRYPSEREDMRKKTMSEWMGVYTTYFKLRKKKAQKTMEAKKYSALRRNARV